MPSRARYAYVPESWSELPEKLNMTNSEIANVIGVDQRHLYNVSSGTTKHARYKTVKKVTESLKEKKLDDNFIDRLFTKV